jgi:hypothetical protein
MSEHRFAVCIRNAEYPVSLELHRLYRIHPDDEAASHGMLRIEDESGDAFLYPREFFDPVMPPPAFGTVALPEGLEPDFVVRTSQDGEDMGVALHRLYPTLPDPSAERIGWIRIIDDSGEDYLYPARLFRAVDVPRALRDVLLRAA